MSESFSSHKYPTRNGIQHAWGIFLKSGNAAGLLSNPTTTHWNQRLRMQSMITDANGSLARSPLHKYPSKIIRGLMSITERHGVVNIAIQRTVRKVEIMSSSAEILSILTPRNYQKTPVAGKVTEVNE